MSSDDTLRIADAERQKAQDLEDEAQRVLQTAQQQADGFRRQAKVHSDQSVTLTQQAQGEKQQEAKDMAEAAREDQEKHDQRKSFLGL